MGQKVWTEYAGEKYYEEDTKQIPDHGKIQYKRWLLGKVDECGALVPEDVLDYIGKKQGYKNSQNRFLQTLGIYRDSRNGYKMIAESGWKRCASYHLDSMNIIKYETLKIRLDWMEN